mgnify:CR=1 FL=1
MRVEVLGDEVCDADGRCMLKRMNIAQALGLYKFQIFLRVLVLAVGLRLEVQLLVITGQLIVVVQGQVVAELLVEAYARLVRPAARYVLDRVASATEHKQRQAPLLDEAHACSVTSQGRVVRAQLVVG